MISDIARRSFGTSGKVAGRTLEGFAVVYNDESRTIRELGRTFTERIAPGAFRSSLDSGADIKLYYEHDTRMPLARTVSGTLRLSSESTGLRFSADIPETTLGNDVKTLLDRGDLTGEMSFGFRVIKDEWNKERTARTVHSAELLEISLVQNPAYPNTHSALRSVADAAHNARTLTIRARKAKNDVG